MTRPSKRKINVKEQERDNNGRFAKKIQTVDNWGDDDDIDSGWDYDNGWDKLCKNKVDDINRTDCCARRIVSLQPDFLSQKSALEEVILEAGHKCIFYPKFHCELNYIERYWGAAKRYARENCDYSWSGLQRVVPTALESVDTITIRRFARKAWRYMDLYRNGITGKLAEYAARKYKSHRCIPEYVLSELNEIKL